VNEIEAREKTRKGEITSDVEPFIAARKSRTVDRLINMDYQEKYEYWSFIFLTF